MGGTTQFCTQLFCILDDDNQTNTGLADASYNIDDITDARKCQLLHDIKATHDV